MTFSLKDVGEILDCEPLHSEAAALLENFRQINSGSDPDTVTLVHIELLFHQRRQQKPPNAAAD